MFVVKKRLAHVLAFLVYSGIASGGEPNVGDQYASGALRGVTRGPDGQPLPQAQVTVHSVAESSDLTVVSGSDGAFLVARLNPGQYQVSAKSEGFATLVAAAVTVTNHQTAQMDLSLARSAPDPGISPAVAKALEAMQKRIEQLEAELKSRSKEERSASAELSTNVPDEPSRTLLATIAKDPSAIPVVPGTLARRDERTVVASNAPLAAPSAMDPAQAGKAAVAQPRTPVAPPEHIIPDALQAPETTSGVDNFTPFAYGDFTWLNGSPRTKDTVLDTKFFTPEIRFDTHYMEDFNQPRDHTIVGATESFRSGEVQVEQASVGGDFHWQNIRGRILFMEGLFATTTPRNDASFGVGQWDLRGAYKYVSEAYGGYHFNVNHGLNVDAGIFVSYIGLFSYYNFDNWTYQPSYVSSNTPWFFNGVRVQWFPTAKLKIEPWFINGWQSYAKYNGHPGLGGQLLWMPKEWLKIVANQYGYGQDNLGLPKTQRIHTDDSIEVRYYNNPASTGISKMAFSLTGDAGCQYGGGISCTGAPSKNKSSFVGWMLYDRMWFHKDLLGLTFGGGQMSNYGRYLTLLPPINGADAVTGSPYFTESPGQKAHMWDSTITLQYMPKQYITWWSEVGYRHSDVPYFAGRGGVTPPGYPLGGTNGAPGQFACLSGAPSGATDLATAKANCGATGVWFPDLRRSEVKLSFGVMVKF
ncbi:MAG TPA: outer membrane beta-barrel protein [Bryobacteraceae bacterium]|nr:outer membrane beta-barrel protein [Bryobacteraceae bacterium]